MENSESQSQKEGSKSWSGIVDDFLNFPPTSSIFRLYLLSFVIWNKGVILYIMFGNADMGDKLAFINWGKFVIFSDLCLSQSILGIVVTYISFYFGPILLGMVLCVLVFGFKKIPSLYYLLHSKHIDIKRRLINEQGEVQKKELDLVSQGIEIQEKKEQLVLKKEQGKPVLKPGSDDFEKGYKNFKKTSFFEMFTGRYKRIFYDKRNTFTYSDLSGLFPQALIDFLIQEKVFTYVSNDHNYFDLASSNAPGNELIKFNEKGEYYIRYYEWEEGK